MKKISKVILTLCLFLVDEIEHSQANTSSIGDEELSEEINNTYEKIQKLNDLEIENKASLSMGCFVEDYYIIISLSETIT